MALVGNPERFDGRRVRVVGYLHLEFEGNALYLHKEDSDNVLIWNAVALSIPPDLKPGFNNEYAEVEGTFKAGPAGHLGLFSGGLRDISLISRWGTREDLQRGASPAR